MANTMEPARPSQDFFGEMGTEFVLAQPGSGVADRRWSLRPAQYQHDGMRHRMIAGTSTA